VRVAADDRKGRERLARYMTRPPLSHERLEKLPDGRYRIRSKKPWRDGTTDIVLDVVDRSRRSTTSTPRAATIVSGRALEDASAGSHGQSCWRVSSTTPSITAHPRLELSTFSRAQRA
jgi:hypothetical protein